VVENIKEFSSEARQIKGESAHQSLCYLIRAALSLCSTREVSQTPPKDSFYWPVF